MTQADETPVTRQIVRLYWYCGYYVGLPKWQSTITDWVYEPDECGAEFETVEDVIDWKEGACYTTCPQCGALLGQSYDEPQMAKR